MVKKSNPSRLVQTEKKTDCSSNNWSVLPKSCMGPHIQRWPPTFCLFVMQDLIADFMLNSFCMIIFCICIKMISSWAPITRTYACMWKKELVFKPNFVYMELYNHILNTWTEASIYYIVHDRVRDGVHPAQGVSLWQDYHRDMLFLQILFLNRVYYWIIPCIRSIVSEWSVVVFKSIACIYFDNESVDIIIIIVLHPPPPQ